MYIHMKHILCFFLFCSIIHSQYDMSFSKFLDKYSAITHCTQDQIQSWGCKLCKTTEKPQAITYIFNEESHILGFMGYLKSLNSIIISWRGTVDIRNWLQDFSFYQVGYPQCQNCFIHEGFYLSFLSVKFKTFQTFDELLRKYPSADILVTGSSLGGALAVVSAIELQLKYGRVKELHVFGCPRVGNIAFAQFINAKIPKTFRVVHNQDIVPHVPEVSQGYHHPATQILFDEKMASYRVCDESGEDPTCSNSFAPDYSISDHITYWQQPDRVDLCTP